MGYSRIKIALGFWVFGLSVFIGCALGFAAGWASMDMTSAAMGYMILAIGLILVAVTMIMSITSFVVCYTATAALYSMVLNRFSVKKIMTEI